jgi:4-amino-4-deoxy-L-arabinose transferase-like glycosyltransferase
METKLIWLFFGLIMLAAGFFRLSYLDYMEYKADERYAFLLAKDLVKEGRFPLKGLGASVGVANPPLFIYLISAFALIKSSPLFIVGGIACLNILAVILTFFFTKKYLGKFAAVSAMGFFSLSTWAIFYSRKLWATDYLPLFSTLFLFFLMKAFKEKEGKLSFLLAGFFGILLFQIHYSGLLVFPYLLLIYFCHQKKFKLKPFFLGALLALIFFLPFLLWQRQTNFNDFEKIMKIIFSFGFSDRKFQLIYPFYPFILSGGLKTFEFLGFDYLPFLASLPKFVHWGSYAVFTSEIILIILGLIFSFKFWKKDVFYSMIALWFLLPVFVLSLTKIGDKPFYYAISFPAQFILIAIALSQIRKIKILKYLSCFGIVAAFLMMAIFNFYLGKFIVQKRVIRGEYGWVYRDKINFIKNFGQELRLDFQDINTSSLASGHNSWEIRRLLAESLDYPQNKNQLALAVKENPGFSQAHYDLALIYFEEDNQEALKKEKAVLKKLNFGLFQELEKTLSR